MLEVMKKIRKEYAPYANYKDIEKKAKEVTTDYYTGETLPPATQKRRYYLIAKEETDANDVGYILKFVGATTNRYRANTNGYYEAIDNVFSTRNYLYNKEDIYRGYIKGSYNFYLRSDNLFEAGYIRAEKYNNVNAFVLENEAIKTADGKVFIAGWHAEAHDYRYCWHCGKYEKVTSGSEYIFTINDNNITYNMNRKFTCCNCVNELKEAGKLERCNECGNYRIKIETTETTETENDYIIDTEFNRILRNTACPLCNSRNRDIQYIKSYHNYTTWETRRDGNDDNSITFGLEIESTPNDNTRYNTYNGNKVAKKVFEECCIQDYGTYRQPLYRFENDGSINGGIETITQPLSINWIHENEHRIQKLCEVLTSQGMIAHDSNCCGLHIHIDRHAIDSDTLSRILYIFEKYQLELVRFSRRQYSELSHWASFLNVEDKKLTMDYAKSNSTIRELGSTRYRALNITNSNTVEVRIFKGTLKYETIIASVELVNNIVTMCRETSDADIINKTFVDIIKYKPTTHLKQYCIDRRLASAEELGMEG